MENATIAGSVKAQSRAQRACLASYEEWHNQCRDLGDGGSVYTLLAAYERTVRASEIDLGLDF